MTMTFQKATKKRARLRLALVGPSGSGKTYSALAIATHLGAKVAVIDTERGSASKYADIFSFDALDLESFSPQQYIDALDAAAKAGYDVVVIDSLSHAWMGAGGALEQVDNIAKRSSSRNTFTAWREVTPQHNAMVDAIIRSPMHVVATMRSKSEWVLEKDDRGKTVPRKIGTQPIQKDGMDFEFDVVGDVDDEHNFIITKTRCAALDGKVFKKAGKDVANILSGWLSDGAEPAPTGLEKALVKSVEAAWPKWLANQQSKMRTMADEGRLTEAWADVVDEIAKMHPPTEYVEALKVTKNELKGGNGAVAQ